MKENITLEMSHKEIWSWFLKHIRTEDVYFSGTILGHMPSGKNNYRISMRRLFKKPEVSQYETSFMIQMGILKGSKKFKPSLEKKDVLMLVAQVFNRDMRRDIDTILFCDLLQKSDVIENDRCIRFKIINGTELDAKNPRVEFWLVKIKE